MFGGIDYPSSNYTKNIKMWNTVNILHPFAQCNICGQPVDSNGTPHIGILFQNGYPYSCPNNGKGYLEIDGSVQYSKIRVWGKPNVEYEQNKLRKQLT